MTLSGERVFALPVRGATMAAVLGAFVGLTAPAGADESAYTKIDFDACETLFFSEEGGSVSLKCDGYAGISVFYNESDLRADVDFGVPNDLYESFASFNSTNDTVEWRLSGGEPFAAILRFYVEQIDGGRRGEVLSIHKVGTGGRPGCTVAYVDARANPDANTLARRVADERVRSFLCGETTPTYVGEVSSSGDGATAVRR